MHRQNVRPFFSSRIRLWTVVLPIALITFTGRHTVAQTSAPGTIHGHITDASGAVVSNVKITAHSPAVGGTFTATSDAEGNYRLIELPPGTDYLLEAGLAGFQKFERAGLIVRAGLNITVDIELKVGSENLCAPQASLAKLHQVGDLFVVLMRQRKRSLRNEDTALSWN